MKNLMKLCIALAITITMTTTTAVFTAIASDYPSKPVQLIVPWGAGGGTDALMRVVAHFSGKYLGKPMVVVNVPGVGGTLGSRQGKDARPDGYTLIATHESVITSQIVGVVDFGYQEFIPLANLTNTPAMVVSRADAPWNSAKEMVEDAKKNPGKFAFGATLGSTSHFFPLDIAHAAGVEFKIVGYEGTAKRQAALLGGFLDLGESNPAAGSKYFSSGKLKPLGIATKERDPLLPDVPTLEEQGIKAYLGVHRGVCAPKGTPDEVVAKLSDVFAKMAADPEFIKKIHELGSTVDYKDSAAYKAYIENESGKLLDLAKTFGIAKKQ